jgi:hypothetical protein
MGSSEAEMIHLRRQVVTGANVRHFGIFWDHLDSVSMRISFTGWEVASVTIT